MASLCDTLRHPHHPRYLSLSHHLAISVSQTHTFRICICTYFDSRIHWIQLNWTELCTILSVQCTRYCNADDRAWSENKIQVYWRKYEARRTAQWINDILNIVLVLCERHYCSDACTSSAHRFMRDLIGDNDYGNDSDASDNDAIRST